MTLHNIDYPKYSYEDRRLTLQSHALRHLQNTELFRLGVADTIITKRFNRRSVAQRLLDSAKANQAIPSRQIDQAPGQELKRRLERRVHQLEQENAMLVAENAELFASSRC
ncbi:MAG: hypothetical protein EOM91_16900 [Sphingobacteriia bacterium]|nr:hypothetical protein [Sphingobacteriia bacterium]NCC39931.1 hypothetical protein [Gammaproteobacteria bacterium]